MNRKKRGVYIIKKFMLITFFFFYFIPKKQLMLLDCYQNFFLVYVKVNTYISYFFLFIPKEKNFEKKK